MRHEPFLPQGDAAALIPGATYSIPGLFLYSSLVYQCLDMVREKFDYKIPVRYMYGSPQVKWNCGRPVMVDHGYTLEDIEAELQGALDRGIMPLLTFSIPKMEERDLDDERGNQILAIANKLGSGVIVSHPLLRDHIRKHYPNIELHASIIMTAFEPNRTMAYYEAIARDYDRYVIHPDDNYEEELLKTLPKDKAELLINERCEYNCPRRAGHFLANTVDQAAIIDGKKEFTGFLNSCPFVPDFKQQTTRARNNTLTLAEVKVLYDMGFDCFKFQGRLDIPYVFFFDFLRYVLEPEVAFPAFYPAFAFAIRQHLSGRGDPNKRTFNT